MNKKTLWITGAAVAAVLVGGSAVAVAVAADDDDTIAAATPVTGSLAGASPSSSAIATDDLVRAAEAAVADVPGEVVDIDRDDDSRHAYEVDVRRTDGTIAEVRLDAAFGVVSVRDDGRDDDGRDDDGRDDDGASPSAAPDAGDADRAGEAALAHVGRGTVVEVTRDDDPGVAWEVEIDLGNDEDVDVELDADLRVLQVKD